MVLLWFCLSGIAILSGAELNAEIEYASPHGKPRAKECARKAPDCCASVWAAGSVRRVGCPLCLISAADRRPKAISCAVRKPAIFLPDGSPATPSCGFCDRRLPCPDEQRTENDEERAHRMRQLSENVLGLDPARPVHGTAFASGRSSRTRFLR